MKTRQTPKKKPKNGPNAPLGIPELVVADKAFDALDDGQLTTSGVKFDNMTFHDPSITSLLLDDLANTEPKRRRRKSRLSSASVHVMFKHNPANIEAIHVWNAKARTYVTLPNIAGEAAKGLSKWHWRILRILADQENVAFSSPAEQLAARRRLREAVEPLASDFSRTPIFNPRVEAHFERLRQRLEAGSRRVTGAASTAKTAPVNFKGGRYEE